MRATAGGRRRFPAGDDHVWPRVVHTAARRVLAERGTSIVGEGFATLDTRDLTPLVDRILASGSDIVLSSFVGADLVTFERRCHAMGGASAAGRRPRRSTSPPGNASATPQRPACGASPATSSSFPGEVDRRFLQRYRAAFGRFAPPVSSISRSAYEAVRRYASAARRAGGSEPRAVTRELRSSRSEFPRGPVTVTGPETVRQDLFLAEASPGGFVVNPSGRWWVNAPSPIDV